MLFTSLKRFHDVFLQFIRVFVNICDESFDSCQLLQGYFRKYKRILDIIYSKPSVLGA